LLALFHHRWGLAILAELDRQQGSKFVTLVSRLGVSRDSLRQALLTLAEAGLVARNPGYGHPMRPEYILTPRGEGAAPAAGRLLTRLQEEGVEEAGLRKWSMPVLKALGEGTARFGDLRAALPGISARALAQALKDLQAVGLVRREVLPSYPPAVSYTLTEAGEEIAGQVTELAMMLADAPSAT
jgi:DNA-binding HxlR family transcriptional regulator